MCLVWREVDSVSTAESAWETQASWRRVPHGFAAGTPKGSDFAPGKVGDI
jgi:hypothetical protein